MKNYTQNFTNKFFPHPQQKNLKHSKGLFYITRTPIIQNSGLYTMVKYVFQC